MSEVKEVEKAVPTLELVPVEVEEEHKGIVSGIKTAFQPVLDTFIELDGLYNAIILESKDGITRDLGKRAKRLRLDHRAVRVAADKIKTAKKAMILVEGRFIDNANNTFKNASSEKEAALEDIEKHYDRLEAELIAKVQQEREDELFKYDPDGDTRNLSGMEQDVWDAFLESKKKAFEEKKAAEEKAEKERIAAEKAEAEEKKRLEEENVRLKAEADERDRLAKIESEKRAKAEAEAKRIQDEKEAKLKAEAEAARLEGERLAKIEADKLAKVQADLKAKEEAEAKRIQDEKDRIAREEAEAEAAKQAELQKGDSEKLKSLSEDLEALKGKYSFKSLESKKKGKGVDALLEKIIKYIAE